MLSIQTRRARIARTTAVLLSAQMLSGCHSRVPIAVPDSTSGPPTAAVLSQLKADDEVRVTLRDGSIAEFVVAEVQADALVAEDGRRFSYADMTRLEKTHVSKGKTIALVGGLIAMGLLVVIVIQTGAAIGSLAGGM